jgi:hypothetical protein
MKGLIEKLAIALDEVNFDDFYLLIEHQLFKDLFE